MDECDKSLSNEQKIKLGLGVSAMPYVMFVSDALWQDTHWTIEDILQIEKEHSELEGLFLWHGNSTPSWNAKCLFMDSYRFIDKKTGRGLIERCGIGHLSHYIFVENK